MKSKAFTVFVMILLLIGSAYFFLTGMVVLDYTSSGALLKSAAGDSVSIHSFGAINRAYVHIYPTFAFAAAALLTIFLLLHFKFPRICGIGMVVVSIAALIFASIAGIVEEHDKSLRILSFVYAYTGFFFYFVRSRTSGIVGAKRLTKEELQRKLNAGRKLVVYQFAFSIVFISYKMSSPVHLVKVGERRKAAILWSIVSILFGPWGVPWGPIYVYQSIKHNNQGGTAVSPGAVKGL